MAELVAISSVWPSGAAFATAFTPTCWPAPGRFSTTNGLPIRCSQTCAAMRASRSVEPAGVNGTTTATVLDGQSCADAEMIAANKTRKGHSSHRGVMGMPPVDLASGDKHAPVKAAAARRPAVAPPSAIGPEVRPSFQLMRATAETPTTTTPARGTGTLTTPSNVMSSRRPMGLPLLTSAPYYIVERENGRCASQQILSDLQGAGHARGRPESP